MKYKLINKQTNEEHLCNKVTIDGFDYYVNDEAILTGDYKYHHVTGLRKALVDGNYTNQKKVIATNNSSIDIPKVIEEFDLDKQVGEWKYKLGLKELKEKADEKFENGYKVDSVTHKLSHRFGYVSGVKEAEERLVPIIMELKSQETHSYSEEDMIEFIEWCNYPIYRKSGNLPFNKRVTAQFPEYNQYLVIDESGESIFPSGKFLTSTELFQLWKEQRPKIVYYE